MAIKTGVIFLLAFFLLFNVVSAIGYDWKMFGNSEQQLKNSQGLGSSNFGLSTLNTTIDIATGQIQLSYPTQPLVASLLNNNQNYLIYSTSNSIKVYDYNASLITSKSLTYIPISSLTTVDWDSDGNAYEIAGFYRESSTNLHFQVYQMNASYSLNNIYDLNYSINATNGVAGVRCDSTSCYSVVYETNGTGYFWYAFRVNSATSVTQQLNAKRTHNLYAPLEPPSKQDYNNDGTADYLVFSENQVMVYDNNGVIIRNWTFSRGSQRDEYVRGAKFVSDSSGYYRVAIAYDVPYDVWSSLECGSYYSCARLQIKSISTGSIVFEDNFFGASSSSDNARVIGLAIQDYNLDGYDDIIVLGATLGTNKDANVQVLKSDGTILNTSTSMGTNVGAVYPNSQITIAKINNDSRYDVLVYDGTLKVWDIYNNNFIYKNSAVTTGQGTCIPADFNYDGLFDIICSDNSSTKFLLTSYNGSLCGNSICESGEDNDNCAIDCPSVEPTQNTTQAEGGLVLPTQIVSTENIDEGILPEIYYGTLGFFSYVLAPSIILIFFIIFVLIMFVIAGIIKKVAHSV
jgi:hypothetical protein